MRTFHDEDSDEEEEDDDDLCHVPAYVLVRPARR